MKRITLAVSATMLLLTVAPASALAGHHRRHHRPHHPKVERFGAESSAPSSSSSADNAGTVQSFSNNVLTITLSDGSTVQGKVNSDTEMECTGAEEPTSGGSDAATRDDGPGDGSEQSGEDGNGGDRGGQGDDDGGEQSASSCSTANLTPGTVVREAELRVSGTGSTWKKVELAS